MREGTVSELRAPRRIDRAPALAGLNGKYLSVTTFRRDGAAVATPVWFVRDFDRLLVETEAGSHKVRRIRRNPYAVIAPCTARGRVTGPLIEAQIEILPDLERARTERLIARKYRFDLLVIRPIRWIQRALHRGRQSGGPVVLAITPAVSMSSTRQPRREPLAA